MNRIIINKLTNEIIKLTSDRENIDDYVILVGHGIYDILGVEPAMIGLGHIIDRFLGVRIVRSDSIPDSSFLIGKLHECFLDETYEEIYFSFYRDRTLDKCFDIPNGIWVFSSACLCPPITTN